MSYGRSMRTFSMQVYILEPWSYVRPREQRGTVSSCPQGAPREWGDLRAFRALPLTKGCMYRGLWEPREEVTKLAWGHRESLRSWDSRAGPQRHSLSQQEPYSSLGTMSRAGPQGKPRQWVPGSSVPGTLLGRKEGRIF